MKEYFDEKFGKNREGKVGSDRYSSEELEFSGGGSEIMGKVQAGKVSPSEVSVLYNNGEITKVHAVYDSKGEGHDLDVYFTGETLNDFLEKYGH